MRSFVIVSCAALIALVLAYAMQRAVSAPSPVEAIVIQDDGQRRPGLRGAGAGAGAAMLARRDELTETLALLGDLNLTPSFTLSHDQKVKIQAVRDRVKQAQDAWRKENQPRLDALQERSRSSAGAGAGASQELRQKRQELMASAPDLDEAAKEILAVLTAEQRKAFDETSAQRREELRNRLRERVRGDTPGRRNPFPGQGELQRN